MTLADKFGILILLLVAVTQFSAGRSFFGKYVKIVFFSAVAAEFASAVYSSFLQREAWKSSAISVFLLPPYRDITYFLSYVGTRIFVPLVIAFSAAIFLKYLSESLNRRFGERFLEPEEGWLLALGVFLSGYPGFLIYLPLMLFAGFLVSAVYFFLGKERAPFFYIWLIVAVFAILLKSAIPQSALNFLII